MADKMSVKSLLELSDADLRATLQKRADRNVSFTKSKAEGPCWCGCGGTTKSRFVPGHDARFHSRAKKAARGELNLQEQLDRLPHEQARAEFQRHHDIEVTVIAASEAADAAAS